jgi:hypothetical protein
MESSFIMTKSRKISWMGHVAWIGQPKSAYKFLIRKPEGAKNNLENLSVKGSTIQKLISNNMGTGTHHRL